MDDSAVCAAIKCQQGEASYIMGGRTRFGRLASRPLAPQAFLGA